MADERGKKILVIDDDEEFANLLGLLLSKKGFDAEVVNDGSTALEKARKLEPTVIVQDYMLPDISGMELLKRFRDEFPASYVIIITARGNEEVAVELMKAGAVDYLKKPFEAEKLLTTIDNVLRLHSTRVEVERLDRELMSVNAISNALNSDMPRDEKYTSILNMVQKNLNADLVNLFTIGRNGHTLKLVVSKSSGDETLKECTLSRNMGLASYVTQSKKPAVVTEFAREKRFEVPAEVMRRGLTSALAVPLMVNDSVKGVLTVYSEEKRTFPPKELKLLSSFANQIALSFYADELTDRIGIMTRKWYGTFDAVPYRVTVVDPTHKILMANKAAATMSGFAVKELIGQNCCWLFHNKKEPVEQCPVTEAIKTKKEVHRVIAFNGPDDEYELSAYPVVDDAGNVEMVVEHARKL